jgi:hypothetical protein
MSKKKKDVAPSINPDERPNLGNYKSKEPKADQKKGHICDECRKSFFSMDELTTHYKKAHPESL